MSRYLCFMSIWCAHLIYRFRYSFTTLCFFHYVLVHLLVFVLQGYRLFPSLLLFFFFFWLVILISVSPLCFHHNYFKYFFPSCRWSHLQLSLSNFLHSNLFFRFIKVFLSSQFSSSTSTQKHFFLLLCHSGLELTSMASVVSLGNAFSCITHSTGPLWRALDFYLVFIFSQIFSTCFWHAPLICSPLCP